MASPVVEEVVESANPTTAATSHTVSLPTATAGQLLLILGDKGSTSTTVNAHGSLTELLDEALANGLYIAYRWMDGTEPASYTLVTALSTRFVQLAYRISGAADPATQAPEMGAATGLTSASPNPPNITAPAAGSNDYLYIAFFGSAGEEADDDTWCDVSPTNYTPSPPRQKTCGTVGSNLGGLIAAAERQLTSGAAEDPGTFTKDVSAAWRSQTIRIHPAAGVPTSERAVDFDATADILTAGQEDVLRQVAIPATASIASAGQEDVLRQAAISATAGIGVTGTILVTHQRQAALDGTAAIAVAAVPVRDRQAAIPATAAIAVASVPVRDRQAAVPATAAIAVAAVLVKERQAALSVTANIITTAQEDVLRQVALAGTADIGVSGTILAAHQRQAALNATAAIAVASVPVRDRQAAVPATAAISVAAVPVRDRQAALAATTDVLVAGIVITGPVTHLRNAALDATGDIASTGTVVSAGNPFKVVNLVATPVSTSQIDLTWDDVLALSGEGYDIERDGVVIQQAWPTNSYSDTGLNSTTQYTYRVRAVGGTVV